MNGDLAGRLLAARDGGAPVEGVPGLDLSAAYGVAAEVEAGLVGQGWTRVGRKLGFTNPTTWADNSLLAPIWAPVYDRTLLDAGAERAILSLAGSRASRLEVEVVVGLARDLPDGPATAVDVVGCVAWVALGFEVVDTHWSSGWQMTPAEAVAGFGLHAALVVGPRTPTTDTDAEALVEGLRALTVELVDEEGEVVAQGSGREALGGPLDSLAHLGGLPGAAPVRGGEVITTGTLIAPTSVGPGQRWSARATGPAAIWLRSLELTSTA